MGPRKINEALIEEMVRLLEKHQLSELQVGRTRVARNLGPAVQMPPPRPDTAATTPAAGETGTELEAAARHPGAVTSPMVGTVYIAPEPGATPFIKVGDSVSEGETLLLIEAMKTMNPIQSPRAGKVTQIFAENEAPVEYGEVLLIIE
jgi:acetyl-CoA carboxylase biotin carboxyl carrier protein